MIDPIHFIVPMVPTGKARPRHMRNGHTYTPKETVRAEATVAKAARAHFNTLLDVPVALRIEAFFPIPTSWSKRKQAQAEVVELRPAVKPDGDNIGKLVMDALNGVAWVDDKSVVDLRVIKRYAREPYLFIKVGEA